MTTRIKGLLVTLQEDWREDDAASIISAITQLRGVLSVSPVPADVGDAIAKRRARSEIEARLWKVFATEL